MNLITFRVKPVVSLATGKRTGRWYVSERAGNGERDGVSQAYTRKHDAKRAAFRKAKRLSLGIPWRVIVED